MLKEYITFKEWWQFQNNVSSFYKKIQGKIIVLHIKKNYFCLFHLKYPSILYNAMHGS